MGLRGAREQWSGENYIMRSLMICTAHKILFGRSNQGEWIGGACSTDGIREMCIQDFGGESEGKRPLGRLRSRWENNIEMEPKEIGYVGMDLFHEVQGSLVDFCEHGNECRA